MYDAPLLSGKVLPAKFVVDFIARPLILTLPFENSNVLSEPIIWTLVHVEPSKYTLKLNAPPAVTGKLFDGSSVALCTILLPSHNIYWLLPACFRRNIPAAVEPHMPVSGSSPSGGVH